MYLYRVGSLSEMQTLLFQGVRIRFGARALSVAIVKVKSWTERSFLKQHNAEAARGVTVDAARLGVVHRHGLAQGKGGLPAWTRWH